MAMSLLINLGLVRMNQLQRGSTVATQGAGSEATRSVADRDNPAYPKRMSGRSQVLVELPVPGG
jgi:hypothetical protein